MTVDPYRELSPLLIRFSGAPRVNMRAALAVAMVACAPASAQTHIFSPPAPSGGVVEIWRHGLAAHYPAGQAGAGGLVVADYDGDGRVEALSLNGGRLEDPGAGYLSVHERQPAGTWRPYWSEPAPDVRAVGIATVGGRPTPLVVAATASGGTELRAFDGPTGERVATVPLTDDGGHRQWVDITVVEASAARPARIWVSNSGLVGVDPGTWEVAERVGSPDATWLGITGELDGTPGREVVRGYDVFDEATGAPEGRLPALAAGDVDSGAPVALHDADGDGVDEAVYPFFRRDDEYWVEARPVTPPDGGPGEAYGVGRALVSVTAPRHHVFELRQIRKVLHDRSNGRSRLFIGTDWSLISIDLGTGDVEWATGVLQPVNTFALADVDGDGETDAVAGTWSTLGCNGCGLLEFNGATGDVRLVSSSFEGPWSEVAVADVDGDGDDEAVYAVTGLRYAETDDTDDFPGHYNYHQSEPSVVVVDPATGDIERRCSPIHPDTGFPRGHEPSLVWGFVGGLAVGEVDGRPGLDVVLAATELYDPAVYVVDPVTCETAPPVVFRSGEVPDRLNLQGVALVDLDGDGVSTAVVTGSARNAKGYVVPAVHEVDLRTGEVAWSHVDADLWGQEYDRPLVTDVTGDGRPDVLALRGLEGNASLEWDGAALAVVDLAGREVRPVPVPGATGLAAVEGARSAFVSVTEVRPRQGTVGSSARQSLRAVDLTTAEARVVADLGEGVAGDVTVLGPAGPAAVASSDGLRLVDLATGEVTWADTTATMRGASTLGHPTLSYAPGAAGSDGRDLLFVSTIFGLRVLAMNAEAVSGEPGGNPASGVALGAARPNPSSGQVLLDVTVARTGPVRVRAFDVLGRSVGVLFEGVLEAGVNVVPVDLRGSAPGVYVVRLTADSETAVQRLTVAR